VTGHRDIAVPSVSVFLVMKGQSTMCKFNRLLTYLLLMGFILLLLAVNSYATLPRTTRGMPIVLGGDPKGKNFLYVNGNSVIIRDIAVSIILI